MTYLVQGGETVHIGRVYVGSPRDQVLHLLLVPGGAGGEEHAAVTESYSPFLALQVSWLTECLTVLPPL